MSKTSLEESLACWPALRAIFFTQMSLRSTYTFRWSWRLSVSEKRVDMSGTRFKRSERNPMTIPRLESPCHHLCLCAPFLSVLRLRLQLLGRLFSPNLLVDHRLSKLTHQRNLVFFSAECGLMLSKRFAPKLHVFGRVRSGLDPYLMLGQALHTAQSFRASGLTTKSLAYVPRLLCFVCHRCCKSERSYAAQLVLDSSI